MQIVQTYPYQNDDPDGKVWWMMNDSASVIMQAIMGKPPIIIKFKIYIKYNIPCGYPKKCGKLSPEDMKINGRCGLQQFLSKPLIIDKEGLGDPIPRNGISEKTALATKAIETVESLTAGVSQVKDVVTSTVAKNVDIANARIQQGFQQVNNEIDIWKNSTSDLISNSWNISKVLMVNDFNMDTILKFLNQTLQEILPSLLDFIPTDCRKIICEAQREAKKDNCIQGFSSSMKNNINAVGLLANNMMDSMKKQMGTVIDGMGNFASTAAQGAKNLWNTFNLYQLCARRFSDYLMDANPLADASPIPLLNMNGFKIPIPIPLFAQLQTILAKQVIGNFIGMLDNCITKNVTKLQIQNSPLLPKGVKGMLKAANEAGDLLDMNNILKQNGTSLNELIKKMNTKLQNPLSNLANTNIGSLADISISQKAAGIDIDQLESLSNNTIVNMNGIKTAVGSLNQSLLKENIIQNLNKTGDGALVAEVIEKNKETLKQEGIENGITDLELAAKQTVDLSNFSEAKKQIYDAIGNNAEKINSLDITSNVGINTSFMDINSKKEADNAQWIANTSDKINTGLDIAEDVTDIINAKSPEEIFSKLNNISVTIMGKMLEKIIRNAFGLSMDQMTSSMSQIDNINHYIKQKEDQLLRIQS